MAYFLGYNNGIELIPIHLEESSNDLLDVVNYTCKFLNLDELKNELYDDNLIPNYDVELCYLIEKGTKNNRNYKSLANLEQIFFASDKSIFNINYIKSYLIKHQNNKEFYSLLYVSYLKKVGVIEAIEKYLTDMSLEDFKNFLNNIIKLLSEYPESYIISDIRESIENYPSQQNINQVIKLLKENNKVLCIIFNYLRKSINFPPIQELELLRTIISLQNRDTINEYSIQNLINKFINSALMSSRANKDASNPKINTRNLVEIGAIIKNYNDYCIEISSRCNISTHNFYQSDEESEEFLEEDDFERCGMASADYGYRLRDTSSKK